jgi:hypothetical protein
MSKNSLSLINKLLFFAFASSLIVLGINDINDYYKNRRYNQEDIIHLVKDLHGQKDFGEAFLD